MASPKTQQSGSTSMVRKLTTTAVMAAIATILMYIEIPIPIMPGFIKLDFSELPALLTSFALGPWYGALDFLIGICFVIPAGLVYQSHKSRKGALSGSIIGAVVMAVISFPINYFIVYPFYTNFMPMEAIVGAYQAILPSIKGLSDALLIFNVPFTFVKGMIDVVITFLVYKRLSPIIKGTNSKKQTPEV